MWKNEKISHRLEENIGKTHSNKELIWKNIKNHWNSTIRKWTTHLKMGKIPEQTTHQRRYTYIRQISIWKDAHRHMSLGDVKLK